MRKISFEAILNKFDYYFIDQWGVIHNGKKKLRGVNNFINILKKNKKKIILISNSSQIEERIIEETLIPLNFNPNQFDKIICSGELINKYVNNNFKNKISSILINKKCYVISNTKDKKNIDFFNLKKTNLKEAKFILAMSLPKKTSLQKINKMLNSIKKFNLTMICTNPDKLVFEGNNKKISFQVGYLADLYEQCGGKVIYTGKPYLNIFKESIKDFENFDKKRSLMIGDSIETDMQGAKNFNIKSLLILNGVHKIEVKKYSNLKNYFRKTYNVVPNYFAKNINELVKY